MRRFIALLAAVVVASSAAAQFTVPAAQLRFSATDGSEHTQDLAPAAAGYIVEFRDPPLVLAAKSAAKRGVASYHATFVRFRADASAILNQGRAAKTAIQPDIRREYFETFNGVSISMPRAAMEKVRELPYVKRVWPDVVMHALATAPPADVVQIGADRVWSGFATRGRGVVVAIIDTGVDYTHPALGGCLGPACKVIGGYDFVNGDNDPMDDAFHGTHVAGTVAGESDTFVGVAPDASLIAYKVLGANGGGTASVVLSAIERTADPNGDGDFSDHADIANMSLGGAGSPDDPLSTAVDNATAAGVLFAIAAGNSGGFHTIGSPGTSRRAITVGAIDSRNVLASFSSRGPNTKDLSIKPEVLAPGVQITSTFPGGRYALLSGTSMATPHVAGAAALIKAVHRDWSPARIKQALMTTGQSVNSDVMAEGGGRIDVFAAASNTIGIDPPVLSFGLYPVPEATWTLIRTLHITNSGSDPVTYNVTNANAIGTSTSVAPTQITVSAGGATDAAVTITVTAAGLAPPGDSFTVGGTIILSSGSKLLRVPWALTKAARATVSLDRDVPSGLWTNAAHTAIFPTAVTGPTTCETLMAPGVYEAVIFAADLDERNELLEARLLLREGQALDGDVAVVMHEAEAAHRVAFESFDESGKKIDLGDDGHIYILGRLGFDTGTLRSISFFLADKDSILLTETSDAKSFAFGEITADTARRKYYATQYASLHGLHGDMKFGNGGMPMLAADVHLGSLIPSEDHPVGVVAVPMNAGTAEGGVGILQPSAKTTLQARIFLAADPDSRYSFGWQFEPLDENLIPVYVSPLLRASGDHIVDGRPWSDGTTTFSYGFSPRFPADSVTNPSSTIFSLSADFLGPLNETWSSDRVHNMTWFYDGANTPKLGTNVYPASWNLTPKGRYRIESTADVEMSLGVRRRVVVTRLVDSTRTDFIPPTLTSMSLLDGSGAMVFRLDPHGAGTLLFSAADYGYSGGKRTYSATLSSDATRLSYRYSGETDWRPLQLTQVSQDDGSGTTLGAGVLFRADASGITNTERAFVDLKIELSDNAGNTSSIVMTPGLAIGPEIVPRRRAIK